MSGHDLTAPVTSDRLPSNLTDPKLKREPYRAGLLAMTSGLVSGGAIGYVRKYGAELQHRGPPTGDVFYDYGYGQIERTQSQNPRWFQDLCADYGVTVEAVKGAVIRALKGGRLGVRQVAVIQSMLIELEARRVGFDDRYGPEFETLRERLGAARRTEA